MTRIERKIWNADRGSFTATGETTDVNIDTLEPASRKAVCFRRPFPQGTYSLGLDHRCCSLAGPSIAGWPLRLAARRRNEEPHCVFRQLRPQAARHRPRGEVACAAGSGNCRFDRSCSSARPISNCHLAGRPRLST